MPKRDRIFGMILVIFTLSTALILSGCIKSEEPVQKPLAPNNNESPIGQKSEAKRGVDSNVVDSNIAIGTITGQGFNESAGVLTKKWDSSNFPGFWRYKRFLSGHRVAWGKICFLPGEQNCENHLRAECYREKNNNYR